MEINFSKITSLVQQIQSHIDDSDIGFISVSVEREENWVHLDHAVFLSEFDSFQLVFVDREKPYYKMTKIVDGVKFLSLIKVDKLVDLKTTMPDRWEHLQKLIQMESR